ncbi:hypothetical protein BC827DRAFT_1383522 [Russula dissimulans]|nr:hypothetical protein BC827DRAFT_1383522 [Russula dissimulans]
MVKIHDPVVEQLDSRVEGVLSTAACGLYIWEFITHLDYEWSVVQGHRPYRWTIWVYSADRLATIIAVIIYLVDVVITTPINCKLAIILTLIRYCLKVLTILQFFSPLPRLGYFQRRFIYPEPASISIWDKNKFVVAFSVAIWLSNASFFIYGKSLSSGSSGHTRSLTNISAEWVPSEFGCGMPNTESNKLAITAMPVTDIALLLVMLIGLLRLRHRGGGRFDLGRLLWKQGVIYLFVATISEITPAVFVFLNLDDSFDVMFLIPSLITMSIAATRMYRSLADFFFSADIGNGSDKPPKRIVTNTKWTTTIPPSPSRMEVTIHTSCEDWEFPVSQTAQHAPYMTRSPNGQHGDKPHGLDLNDDVESNVAWEK